MIAFEEEMMKGQKGSFLKLGCFEFSDFTRK